MKPLISNVFIAFIIVALLVVDSLSVSKTWGERDYKDSRVSTKIVVRPGNFYKCKETLFAEFPEENDKPVKNITAVYAMDQTANARSDIEKIAGGIGFNKVKLQINAKCRHRVKYVIEIYGHY